jgi:hypothetical protein
MMTVKDKTKGEKCTFDSWSQWSEATKVYFDRAIRLRGW